MQKIFKWKYILNFRINKVINYGTTHIISLKIGQREGTMTGKENHTGWNLKPGIDQPLPGDCVAFRKHICSPGLSFPMNKDTRPVCQSCFGDERK